MRRALIVCLAILLLGGGGIALWKVGLPYLQKEDAGAAEAKPLPAPTYVELAPFIVPMIREGVVTQHLTLAVKLEVRDMAAFGDMERRLPQLTDAFLTELYSLYSLRYVQEHAEDLHLAKERLMKVGTRVLGEGVLSGVLITGIQLRRLDQRRG